VFSAFHKKSLAGDRVGRELLQEQTEKREDGNVIKKEGDTMCGLLLVAKKRPTHKQERGRRPVPTPGNGERNNMSA